MVATIKFTSAKSGVVHDGTSMIVMNEGKVTEAPAAAEELLREKEFIVGKVRKGKQAVSVDDPALAAALARAEAAEARAAELEAKADGGGATDQTFELAGITFTEKGGGHFDITGPDGFEPIKVRGVDAAKEAFLGAVIDAATGPNEQAPAS